jgi:NAD+ synthase (glutamine-hydrolysing)
MKIALAQINYHIGHFESNERKVLQAIEQARKGGAELVVFSELAVSGYPPRDFLEFDDFIQKCLQTIENIAKNCIGIAAIIGGPSPNPEIKGKRLFNTAFFLQNGKAEAKYYKGLLPNYDVFDEYRYFEPSTSFDIIRFNGMRLAVTICEDLWNIGNDTLYRINPMDELYKLQPDLIINIAASPFHYLQAANRKKVLHQNVEKYKLPLLYVNHVGAQTELLFDGGSLVYNRSGVLVDELKYFEEDFKIIDTSKIETPDAALLFTETPKIELIHDALIMGIKNYFEKLGFKKAILGLSGGIDSAVTLVLAVRALGAINVRAMLLPSRYSSKHSIHDAVQLAENLNVSYDNISIEEAFQSFERTLAPVFKNMPPDLTEENIQARVRGTILMGLCNKYGHILLNTSNKSEAAVGYGTLYGDMNGGLSVLGDVYKTDVFELARYINREKEVIPVNTILKPPSAELRPDQKDSDSLPEYDLLDKILFDYIELRMGPKEIIAKGFDEKAVRRILRLVNTSEYKRHQTPPILRVSPKAFGMGRKMPIVAKYLAEDG